MNVLSWAVQILIAAIFLYSGTLKSTMSKERMIATGQTGVAPFPLPVLRIVAMGELVGAVGLILPWALGIDRFLTPLAAACLIPIMIGAAASHASLSEFKQVFMVNTPLLVGLAGVIAIRVGEL